MKKILSLVGGALLALSVAAASYPSADSFSTEPGVWTRNFSGVIEAARTTGYPIFLIVVNSPSCGHCSMMMDLTVNTPEFQAMESELTFYKVIMDEPYSSGSADWGMVTSGEYISYFDYNMYPLVAVVRRDGTIYHAYGNSVTDERGVAGDIRSWIEALTAEQVNGYVAPAPAPTPAPAARSDAGGLKGKYSGITFDSSLNVVGSFAASMTAKGKMTIKAVMGDGKWTRKGQLTKNAAGTDAVMAGGLELTYDSGAGIWSGTEGGLLYVARRTDVNGPNGLYTAGLTVDGLAQGGVSVELKRGKAKVSGLVNGKNNLKSTGMCVTLPASFVAAKLPGWSTGGDVLFAPAVKAGSIAGGFVITGERLQGKLVKDGIGYAAQGFAWHEGTSIRSLSRLEVGPRIETLQFSNDKRLIGPTDKTVKVTVNQKKGTFKGKSPVDGGKVTVEGVLVGSADGVMGFGTSYGAGVFPVRVLR